MQRGSEDKWVVTMWGLRTSLRGTCLSEDGKKWLDDLSTDHITICKNAFSKNVRNIRAFEKHKDSRNIPTRRIAEVQAMDGKKMSDQLGQGSAMGSGDRRPEHAKSIYRGVYSI